MGSRHYVCLKVILEKVHSPVGENMLKIIKNGTDDRWWVEKVKNKLKLARQ